MELCQRKHDRMYSSYWKEQYATKKAKKKKKKTLQHYCYFMEKNSDKIMYKSVAGLSVFPSSIMCCKTPREGMIFCSAFNLKEHKMFLSLSRFGQARSQDRFWRGAGPPKSGPFGPKSGLFWTSTPYPPTKTPFLAHFVAKSGPFDTPPQLWAWVWTSLYGDTPVWKL